MYSGEGEAIEAHRHAMQRNLSCVTRDVLIYRSLSPSARKPSSGRLYRLELGGTPPANIGGTVPLGLNLLQLCGAVHQEEQGLGWAIQVRSYLYTVEQREGDEIIAYHWHPFGASELDFPHFHVGRAITGAAVRFADRHVHQIHFPTGHVPLASIIRLLIEEFGVQPLREGWRDVLRQADDSG